MSNQYAKQVVAYMELMGYKLFRNPGEINIIYVEGADLDGKPNADEADRFNDLGLLLQFNSAGEPEIVHRAVCTTEPGAMATFSATAIKLGGVARVQLIQYLERWKIGYHKKPDHPALVQCAPVLVCRDRNRDFKRTKDPIMPATGINHHGTRPDYVAKFVGMFSLGCSVRLHWDEHIEFIRLLKTDPRYLANPDFRFSATYLDGGKVAGLRNFPG